MKPKNLMLDIFQEIAVERGKQDAKWGEQNHSLVCEKTEAGPDEERHGWAHAAEHMKALNDARAQHDASSWDCILLEEVYEAFAEADVDKARAELVQAAAVIVAVVESIDRRAPRLRAA